jgi:hypothetical protein
MAINNQQRAGQGATATGAGTTSVGPGYSRIPMGGGRNPAAVLSATTQARATANMMQFPSDLPPINFSFIQAHYASTARLDQARAHLTTKGMISLPMPLNISDAHRVIYNDGYSYLGAASDIAGGLNAARSGGGTGASAIGGALGSGLKALGNALGFSLNSFRGVTIEQPQFKAHQFQWKLSPKTLEESITLQKIITNLKKSSALDWAFGSRVAFKFPDVFVPFFSNSVMMFKFKPCVISAVDVDYVGGNEGPSFFRNESSLRHAPESISLTLTFLEIEYWVKDDFKVGGDGLPTEIPTDAMNWAGLDDAKGAVDRFRNRFRSEGGNVVGVETVSPRNLNVDTGR